MDVLLIGRDARVLEAVKGALVARGIAADGTTDAERASIDFDARNFALVAFGGGLGNSLREMLKRDFKRQNPDVILIDTFAPVAAPHIMAALRANGAESVFASRFETTEDNGAYIIDLDLKKECDVSVEVYHVNNGFHGATLGRGHVLAGSFVYRIHEREIHAGLNMIVVALDGSEYHFHRVEEL
jgi:hypothetical protein